jgi:hypothetical protein
MHRMPPRITQESCRPRVSDRTMVGPLKPTRLLAKLPEPKASNHHRIMKLSSANRQLPGLSGIRREPTASPELRFGWMQATIRPLSEREGENFFLTSPLIGLIEEPLVRVPGGWSATLPLRPSGQRRVRCGLPVNRPELRRPKFLRP